ncbi:putative nucleic acid-binding protein [Rosa chinensis]|uniref:Putative nucleic acid-binding protein n=1 Tax=Rosa chinensis TaxID=74649 RepID=A0A2P6QAD0_ROSCH|nr:putative nucleic acid-binding protein [Rosa chinensis]
MVVNYLVISYTYFHRDICLKCSRLRFSNNLSVAKKIPNIEYLIVLVTGNMNNISANIVHRVIVLARWFIFDIVWLLGNFFVYNRWLFSSSSSVLSRSTIQHLPASIFLNKGTMHTYTNARGQGRVFNVELTDEDGAELQATMFNEAARKFFEKFQLGKVYYVSKGALRLMKSAMK